MRLTRREEDMRVKELEAEVERLQSFIAQSVPFLLEAWEACFDGRQKKLLSAEERGMGDLIQRFKAIAKERPVLPPGVITQQEASAQLESAIFWAHRLLGSPNEMRQPLAQYVYAGETCADGLDRAHGIIERQQEALRRVVEKLKSLPPEETSSYTDEWPDEWPLAAVSEVERYQAENEEVRYIIREALACAKGVMEE